MNKRQYDRVVRIINKDANGREELSPRPGVYCVIGGLLKAAGVPRRELVGRELPTQSMCDLLEQTFGLHPDLRDTLMSINDEFNDDEVVDRRDALIGELSNYIED